jgi:hypothetical protein
MVRTKAYTLNRLIAEVSALRSSKVNSYTSLVFNLSPKARTTSAKLAVLNQFLNGQLRSIAQNAAYGKTVKQRVLKALRARKRYGSDFSV